MSNNFLTKLWYKIFNKGKYIDLKNEKRTSDRVKYYNSRIYLQILEIQKKIKNNKELSFLHSGRLGDLIYSLATIKELSKSHKCKLYIQIEQPMFDHNDSSKKVTPRSPHRFPISVAVVELVVMQMAGTES